jgi:cardiolipin synthase A/B
MFDAMSRARDHINLQVYILEQGEVGERLAALLKRKAGEGVKVNVLYDSMGSLKTPKHYFAGLRESGVAVCEFNPVGMFYKLNNRDHRKILVVDGRVGFTGGVNLSDTYAASSRKARRVEDKKKDKKEGWRDTHVQVEGPVVARLQRLFLDAWALQDCGPYTEARYYPPLEPRGAKPMQLVRGDPDHGSETYSVLLEKIAAAKARVWLTQGYFVPDPRLKQALIDAADRGVDVQLVLPGFSDFWAPVYAGRSHYEDLLAAGVRIHEWHEALMHAKTAVVDSSWAVVGSTNLDWRSFVHNYEADLVVHDAAFARELERRFRQDVEAAQTVDPEAWRRRGSSEKLKEWLARQWEYLL